METHPRSPGGAPPDVPADSWEAGIAAGFAWASEEAERGYLHPLIVHSPQTAKIVIEHAHEAFGGRCRGRPRLFIRGFVHGVSEFWRERTASGS